MSRGITWTLTQIFVVIANGNKEIEGKNMTWILTLVGIIEKYDSDQKRDSGRIFCP